MLQVRELKKKSLAIEAAMPWCSQCPEGADSNLKIFFRDFGIFTRGMTIDPRNARELSTSDFQSEVGEVFGEIGGELPAKFGRRFSSFFCWGKSSETFSTKTPPQISPSNFTTRFWVVAGPREWGKSDSRPKNGEKIEK